MKTTKIQFAGIIVLLFSSFSVSYAQLSVPFKVRYQGLINGDMTVIANNIVNRSDYNNSANEPYYNHTSSATLNDDFMMQYIDIDDDEETFSSSSAELFFDKASNKRIVYAGLYWAATYKYNAGIESKEQKFTAIDAGRESFSNIKLKLPNQKNYLNISGEILFDGKNQKEYSDFSPYVAYSDVTDYIKKMPNPSGVYTVANVRATQGTVKGGTCGGWTLIVVYQDDSMSAKYINSYDGFAGASDKPVDVTFSGYQAPLSGNVTAKIAFAALDGDNNVAGDQLLFGTNETKKFKALSNITRPETNFFNSSITSENQFFMNRFPDSKNTLGYDAGVMTIPNTNNVLIPNGNKQSSLRLITSGDKLNLFFTAFALEASPVTNETASNDGNILVSNEENQLKITTYNRVIKFIPSNNDMLVENYKTTSSFNRDTKIKTYEVKNKIVEIQTLTSSKIINGYYLIVNIFKSEDDAKRFITFLSLSHIQSDYFINNLNKYSYVFLKRTDSQQEAIELYLSKMNESYKDKIQILVVNKTESELIADAKKSNKTKSPYEIQVASIPNEGSGFYVVANVFLHEENANKFAAQLKENGLKPKILVNKETNYNYVYLAKVSNEEEAISLYLSKLNDTYQGRIWILSVNNNSKTITSNDD